MGKRRTRPICEARHIAVALAYEEHGTTTLGEVGTFFDRDHDRHSLAQRGYLEVGERRRIPRRWSMASARKSTSRQGFSPSRQWPETAGVPMGYKHSNRCLDKARDDEPIFVLLARDRTAKWVVRLWCIIAWFAGASRSKASRSVGTHSRDGYVGRSTTFPSGLIEGRCSRYATIRRGRHRNPRGVSQGHQIGALTYSRPVAGRARFSTGLRTRWGKWIFESRDLSSQ